MQVIALLAQKGGAGKTSLALALAVEAGGRSQGRPPYQDLPMTAKKERTQ